MGPIPTSVNDASRTALERARRGRRLSILPAPQSCGKGGTLPRRISRPTAAVQVIAVMKGNMNVVPIVSAIVLGRCSGMAHRATAWTPLVPSQAMVELTTMLMTAVTPSALTITQRRLGAGIVIQSSRQWLVDGRLVA